MPAPCVRGTGGRPFSEPPLFVLLWEPQCHICALLGGRRTKIVEDPIRFFLAAFSPHVSVSVKRYGEFRGFRHHPSDRNQRSIL